MLKFISILLTREFKKIYFIFFILIILFVSLIVCYFSYKDYSFNNHQNIVVQKKLLKTNIMKYILMVPIIIICFIMNLISKKV